MTKLKNKNDKRLVYTEDFDFVSEEDEDNYNKQDLQILLHQTI